MHLKKFCIALAAGSLLFGTVVSADMMSEGKKAMDAAKDISTKAEAAKAAADSAIKGDAPAKSDPAADAKKVSDLMNAKGYTCLGCHSADSKMVGPSYKEVSAKYKGDKEAATKLAKKVKEGGVGTWGQIPMPPNASVTDDDMKTIISWILSL